jgi:hypothetical protein
MPETPNAKALKWFLQIFPLQCFKATQCALLGFMNPLGFISNAAVIEFSFMVYN